MDILQARRAARECALLLLFYLENAQGELPIQPPAQEQFEQQLKMSLFSLTQQAQGQVEEAAGIFKSTIEQMTDLETNDPANLARPLESVDLPVALPDTQAMKETLNQCLYAVELLWEAFRSPQLLIHGQDRAVQKFAMTSLGLVCKHSQKLDAVIDQYSSEWRSQRLFKMDRLILKLALAELFFVPNVDMPVTINEAIELSKQYSTAESYRFINGLLGKIAESIKAGELQIA